MSQWTSSVGAQKLAHLLGSQHERDGQGVVTLIGGRRAPAYRSLADGIRLLVLEDRKSVV